MHPYNEAVVFQCCSDITGNTIQLDVCRQNGQLTPILAPVLGTSLECGEGEEKSPEYNELVEEVCQNLNPRERATWLKLIDGRSILEIAEDEHVRRAAIYHRIRGDKRSPGMIHKNSYCAIWWRLRHEKRV